MILQAIADKIRQWHSNVKARVANYLAVRYTTKVLRLTHAAELVQYPRNEWPLIVKRQQEEIRAVASGQMDIIDRRSWAYPYLPEALHRLNQPILKNTPYNLRRFSETPIARRAINLIKNAILSRDWEIVPMKDAEGDNPETELRIQILEEGLTRPNNTDSWRDLMEAVIEDFLIGGYGCIEPRLTPYYKRPFKLWAVDGSTIRIFMDWSEATPDRPRYAQMTGLKGERGIVTFLSDELIYIRDNVRTSTPFGLGRLEVVFNTLNAFLGAQDMASRAGSDQVHKTWLWWEQTVNPAHLQTVRRHIINELEGQAKISLMAGMKKPDAIEVQAVTPDDLLLEWQEFLIRIIATGFDLSPQTMGLERDVNRNTASVMAESDWRNAVVPPARRIEEAVTRYLIHGILNWKDLQFQFIGLEDPDSTAKAMLQRMQYMMDALTTDEIRETNGLPKLPGGWGKLAFSQKTAVIQAAIAKITGKAGTSGSSFGGGSGFGGMGGGMGTASMGGGLGGMRFAAQDVAQMTPEEVQMYQELGLLPPTQQLTQQMEQSSPGILETISDELRQYFEQEKEQENETEVQPSSVTPEMEKYQQKKFQNEMHEESLAEQTINRRGFFGPAVDQSVRKNAQRGKYAKDASGRPQRQLPKGHYRPGKGNERV